MIRLSHSSSLFGKVTRLLLVALVFYFAFKMWTSGDTEPPADTTVETVTESDAGMPPADAEVKTPFVTQLQSVEHGAPATPELQDPTQPSHLPDATLPNSPTSEPGTLPVSIYAILLQGVQQLITDGHVGQAEAKLVALPPEALDQPQTRQAVGLLWNNLGVLKLEKQGAPAAVPALETALRYLPDSPEVHVNLAQVYWEAKHPGLTRSFLEKTIGLAPADPLPHLVLADYLYEQDDLAGSARHLDQATRTIVKKPELRAYLNILSDKVKRADKAEHRFVAKSSLHFRVKFNGTEDYFLWDKVLDILEEAYREIGQKFGYFPGEAITVVLHTQQTFQTATGSPAWADGLYDSALGRIQIPTQGALTDRERLRKVLRHEFVHALLHQRMGTRGRVPQWLNEGLAMQLAGDAWPDLDQVIDAEVTLIPLNSLEGSWGGFPGNLATMAYLEGNSATRFLIERFGMERARAIVDTLAQGKPIGAAIKDRLFMDYQAFQEQWIVDLNEKLRGGHT